MQSVYLDNNLGFHQGQSNNLEVLTKQLDDGKRSLSTISATLAGLGIPKDKVVFAIKNYTKAGVEAGMKAEMGTGLGLGNRDGSGPGGRNAGDNQYKKNKQTMQFDLNNLAKIIGALKNVVLDIKESNVDKINYSANSSYQIIESIQREIVDLQAAFKKIDENKDDIEKVALIKESIHPAVFKSKPEYHLLNKTFQHLSQYSDVVPVKEFLNKTNMILKENFYTNYISNLIYEMLNLSEHKFYSDTVEDLQYLLKNDETYIKETLTLMLNKHSWIPRIKQVLDINAAETQKLTSNSNAVVEKVYSPVQVNEDGSYIFLLEDRFYQINKNKTLQKIEDSSKLTPTFHKLASLLKDYKVNENKVTLYKHNKSLELVFEENQLSINGIQMDVKNFERVKDVLLGSTFFRLDELHTVNDVLLLIENIDMIKHLDVVDKIVGHNGNIVNIIRLSESNIYINRVNEQVLTNELHKAENFKQAQQIVNEFVEFDISNSVYEILEKEDKERVKLNEKIEVHEKRITFLNEQLERVNTANEDLQNSKLNETIKLLKDELRKEEVEVQNLYGHKAKLN